MQLTGLIDRCLRGALEAPWGCLRVALVVPQICSRPQRCLRVALDVP